MALQSTKIVLKETTKMTLHERFSIYRQNNLLSPSIVPGGAIGPPSAHQRQMMANHRQASAKNQRLAVQMANRPSVVAALKLKKRSLKQRLGSNGNLLGHQRSSSNVKARLALSGSKPGLHNRLGNNNNPRIGRGRFPRGGGGGFVSAGTSPLLKGRLGLNAIQDYRNRSSRVSNITGTLKAAQQNRQSNRGHFKRGRGFNRNAYHRQLVQQQQQQVQNPGGKNRTGNRWQPKQGRGRGGRIGRPGSQQQQGGGGKIPTKQDLDNDIDQYMAQTKNHLDAELDAYMAQTE